MIKETEPVGPIGNLLHKASLLRLEDIVDLPSTQKQTQRGSPNGETNKCASNVRTGEISKKRSK